MCVSGKAPDVPTIPERQAVQAPKSAEAVSSVTDRAKRRRGMMASILTSAQGATGPIKTTLGG